MWYFVQNCRSYVLLRLSDRKLALNHEFISESVLVNAIWSPSLGLVIMLVSSAKSTTLESLSVAWISYIYK